MEASRFESALSWLPAYSAVAAENKEPLSVEAVYRTKMTNPGQAPGRVKEGTVSCQNCFRRAKLSRGVPASSARGQFSVILAKSMPLSPRPNRWGLVARK